MKQRTKRVFWIRFLQWLSELNGWEKKIVDKFRSKIADLKKHNKFYYTDDSPKIKDSDYDLLKNDIFNLEKNINS